MPGLLPNTFPGVDFPTHPPYIEIFRYDANTNTARTLHKGTKKKREIYREYEYGTDTAQGDKNAKYIVVEIHRPTPSWAHEGGLRATPPETADATQTEPTRTQS